MRLDPIAHDKDKDEGFYPQRKKGFKQNNRLQRDYGTSGVAFEYRHTNHSGRVYGFETE